MRRLLLISILSMALLTGKSQYSHSLGFGLTATDVAASFRYGLMFFDYEGWLGEKLNGNGFYIIGAKGCYPEWNLAGAKDHWKLSAGFMYGAPFDIADWWPTINIGIAHHWLNTYPGFEITNQPVFQKWDIEFGSAGQIGHYYPWVTVALFRQLEMTFGFGVTF